MAIKISNVTVIDDSRNITNVNTYNGYTPASQAVSITAGNGLSGGGDLSASRTLSVGQGDGISVNSTTVSVNSTVVRTSGNQTISGTKTFNDPINVSSPTVTTHATPKWYVDGFVPLGKYVSSNVSLNSITSSGFYRLNQTYADSPAGITLDYGHLLMGAVDDTGFQMAFRHQGDSGPWVRSVVGLTGTPTFRPWQTIITSQNIGSFIPSSYVTTSRTIATGNGLTGGGDLSSNRTISVNAGNGITANATGVHVGQGDGISVNSTAVSVNSTVVRTSGDQTISGSKTFSSLPSVTSSSGAFSGLYSQTNGSQRWFAGKSSNAETGSNTGSDFIIASYDDAGNWIGGALTIERASRIVSAPNGSGIQNLNASYLSQGTIPDARISSTFLKNSGNQTISNGSLILSNSYMSISGPAGTSRVLFLTTNNVSRFALVATSGAETGSNTGSDFTLNRYDDSGAYINAPLVVARSTGQVTIPNGSGIQNLNASYLSQGTIPDARIASSIARSNISITAGNGLSGGGDLTANRTLSVNAGQGLIANSTGLHVVAGSGLVSNTTGLWVGQGSGITVSSDAIAVDSTVVRTSGDQTIGGVKSFTASTRINTAAASSGGTYLTTNGTFRWFVGKNTDAESGSNAGSNLGILSYNDAGASQAWALTVRRSDNLVTIPNGAAIQNLNASYLSQGTIPDARIASTIARSNISITAGNGLTGGGDLTASRTLAVGQGSGISVNSTAVSVDSTVIRTTGDQTISGIKTFTSYETRFSGAGVVGHNFQQNGSTRWIARKNDTVESGSNAGSNYEILRYSDTGTYLGLALSIERNTGRVVVANGSGIQNLNASYLSSGTVADAILPTTAVRTSMTIATGNGLAGGGDLSANRTLSVNAGQGLIANSTGVHVVAGSGLMSNTTGLWVGQGTGISVNSTAVSVDSTVVRRGVASDGDIRIGTSLSNTIISLGSISHSGAGTLTIDSDNAISVRADTSVSIQSFDGDCTIYAVGRDVNIGGDSIKLNSRLVEFEKFSNDEAIILKNNTITTSNAILRIGCASNNQYIAFRNDATTILGSISRSGSTTVYATSSDYRLKENVEDLSELDALETLDKIKPRKFNFISEPEDTIDGFIAHELAEALPHAVVGKKDGIDADGNPEYQAVDASKVVPTLVTSLKYALKRIDDLENKIKELESSK